MNTAKYDCQCVTVVTMSLRSLVTLCFVLLSSSYAQSKLHLCVVVQRQLTNSCMYNSYHR